MSKMIFLSKRRSLIVFLLMILLLFVIYSIPSIFAVPQAVKSIEIFSEKLDYKKNEAGAWRVTKSTKWISRNEALITFDVDSIKKVINKKLDVLFVLDISGSMEGDKLDRVKSDALDLIETLLSDEKNRAGLITFDTHSDIVLNFTNEKDLLKEKVNSLMALGTTNYYQALVNVDKLMKDYVRETDRNCVVLFLTDGYPNEDTPNEVGQYKYLKDQYPFILINTIQYEMGSTFLEELSKISDGQYVADMKTLNNVLFDASITSALYSSFKITDYIDSKYFYVDNVDDIKVSQGSVVFDNSSQKIDWVMDSYGTGSKASMSVRVKVQDKLPATSTVLSVGVRDEITSKVEEVEENVISTQTPSLDRNYKVIYDGNAPDGCSLTNVPVTKNYSAFETVEISDNKPKCDGYQFKGWDIVTKDVVKVNDDYFTMPGSDVEIRGTWFKLNVKKSMEGKVKKSITLYKQVEEDVSNTSKYAREYTGDTSTFIGKEKIYYYYGAASNNNVVFADYCWKIVRTTDTGGVKLLYNGVPSSDGSCNNTNANAMLTAEQMNQSGYEIKYNLNSRSVADAGYMYNARYSFKNKNHRTVSFASSSYMSSSGSNYYYADSYTYSNSTYTLVNPEQYSWTDSYESLEGKYTFKSSLTSGIKVYYIIRAEKNKMSYVELTDGKGINDSGYGPTITLGETVTENGDGTFTINDPIDVHKADWISGYDYFKYRYKYTCGGNETTCHGDNLRYIVEVGTGYYCYIIRSEYVRYGGSFEYDGTNYVLKDTIDTWNPVQNNILANRHYTCFNTSGICKTLLYITSSYTTGQSYVEVENGKSPDSMLREMISDDNVNKESSNIKKAIDYWYENNMTDYTSYLEDAVWCNDRKLDDQGVTSWEPNSKFGNLIFGANNENNHDLICPNKIDRFTVESKNGNGALTYPVGMITEQEREMAFEAGDQYDSSTYKSPLAAGSYYWTISPSFSNNNGTRVFVSANYGNGYVNGNDVVYSNGVRPAISLRPNIEYMNGDGSVEYPYYIDVSDIEAMKKSIDVQDDRVSVSTLISLPGKTIKLVSNDVNYVIKSYKVNGNVVEGDSFIMPDEDVVISDIVLDLIIFLESEHNPYSNNLNDIQEKTIEGANSLTIELDCQTESTTYDWIYLYDNTGKEYGKYGGTTRKIENITVPGDYVKILFRTDGSGNSYYGYKAIITPNYN